MVGADQHSLTPQGPMTSSLSHQDPTRLLSHLSFQVAPVRGRALGAR